MTCSHSDPRWRLTGCNEDGWACGDCGQLLGFRPDLDREQTREKVEVILMFMHEGEFMYVSNSTMGDGMVAVVAKRCHEENTFDQLSIMRSLIDAKSDDHVQFWQTEAKQYFCQHPARELVGDVARCRLCDHEVKQQPAGPLFASEEPF